MMGLDVTLFFYLVTGMGVAIAVFLADRRRGGWFWGFRLATATLFWPIYLPLLLARPGSPAAPRPEPDEPARDAMASAIAQVESELDAAFRSLDGWAEDVLARETGRLRELRSVWRAQADRLREMDRLLARESAGGGLDVETPGGRLRQSEQARRANLDRLRQVRRRAHDDLMGTLAWVRELVSMIHLAKFTGAPASRAEELVGQIAAAVEGVSAVAGNETCPTAAAKED
jgi:hypothetical protein